MDRPKSSVSYRLRHHIFILFVCLKFTDEFQPTQCFSILVSFNFGGFQRLRYVERGANVLTGHRRRCHGNVNGRHSVAIQLLIDDVTITTD